MTSLIEKIGEKEKAEKEDPDQYTFVPQERENPYEQIHIQNISRSMEPETPEEQNPIKEQTPIVKPRPKNPKLLKKRLTLE